jgi:hypothetical protein
MSRDESGYSERVGARISPELKEHLRVLVDDGVYDSEADAVREALWQYVEQREIAPPPLPEPVVHETADNGQVEWLLSAVLVMLALVGSRLLNALTNSKTTPAALADEAIQETIYNHAILQKKLRAARHTSHDLSSEE